jgi:phage terminase large subunit
VYYMNGGYILDEIAFAKGLSNKDIADILKKHPRGQVVADSAEPKSIDEIKSYGISIVPSTKGPGSVLQGIQYVQEQKIAVTKRSLNVIKEYRNYVWQTDKTGRIINEPDHLYSHSMDAIRYKLGVKKRTPAISWV